MEVPDDMKQAGQQFLAEEHADQAKVAAKVEAMQEANAPETPPSDDAQPPASSPPPAAAADPAAQQAQLQAMKIIAEKVMPHVGSIAWGAIDMAVQKFAGQQYALSVSDKELLVAGTQPLINKYIPKDFLAFLETPEGLAVGTVVFVYGVKFAQVQGVSLFGAAPAAPTASPTGSDPKPPLEQRMDDLENAPAPT